MSDAEFDAMLAGTKSLLDETGADIERMKERHKKDDKEMARMATEMRANKAFHLLIEADLEFASEVDLMARNARDAAAAEAAQEAKWAEEDKKGTK